ncbi:MAG: hypothetical protein K0R55_38, partial [Sporomusa sp.]|nr:hypothetical protein [Sporomusa sp.]
MDIKQQLIAAIGQAATKAMTDGIFTTE